MIREDRDAEAAGHLEAFLASPPHGPEAEQHISHARTTLAELRGEPGAGAALSDG
jgi:hypothetical protein